MSRQVAGIRRAEFSLSGPPLRRQRATGSKAAGLAYEKKLGKLLPPEAKHGLWIKFEDAFGPGWCQPDYIFAWHRRLVVLEAKLSYTEDAWSQLENLYLPLVSFIAEKPAYGVQACKWLTPLTPPEGINSTLETAVLRALEGKRSLWHCLGGS